VYQGILYATTHLGTYAIDAINCHKVWSHQHVARGPEMNATNKGVALADGRIIRGTQDGASTRSMQEQATYSGSGRSPIGRSAKASAPHRWCGTGLVFIGKAGGDWGIKGAIMALKVEDGSLVGRFDVTPTEG